MPQVSRDFVRAGQMALKDLGFDPGKIDGLYGPKTRAAQDDYLADRAAPAETPAPTFKGAAKRLDDIDLPKIGAQIGLGEDELHAVIDVEARGSGFDSEGRVAMLFEPHIFYRELGAGEKRERALSQGLAYKRWGERAYPRDSYPRLHEAMEIDEDAALRSASWGMGQIMGFNAKMAGYPTARSMVEAFAEDEEAHLQAMVSYIIAAGLDDELRRHDWRGFARGYNGPGYATHGYHTKLGNAFLKWEDIPDTPFDRTPEAAA